MTYATTMPSEFALPGRTRAARRLSKLFSTAVALAFSLSVGVMMHNARPIPAPQAKRAVVAVKAPTPKIVAASVPAYDPLLDPSYSFGGASVSLAASAPLASSFKVAEPVVAAAPVPAPVSVVAAADEDDSILPPMPPVSPLIDTVPLPTPRPAELQAQPSQTAASQAPESQAPARSFGRQRRNRAAMAAAAPQPDTRSFFEKLFGVAAPAAGPVLAYASPEDGLFGRNRLAPAPPLGHDHQTAIYDISAHTVYMPDGTRLEAHSGLGSRLDDPHYVHERMRGPTPPHLYDLTLREQLFHGVQALRLNPVGGGGVYGRSGLLAHTFMLGPNGDSNGCVSFRDYRAFLRAYSNGEVRRLEVVARM